MISLDQCRKVLQKYGTAYTEAEVKVIRDWLIGMAHLEYDIVAWQATSEGFTLDRSPSCNPKEV